MPNWLTRLLTLTTSRRWLGRRSDRAQQQAPKAMAPQEAVAFLLERTGRALPDDGAEAEAVAALAAELGPFPLALEAAGTCIRVREMPFEDYLDRFRAVATGRGEAAAQGRVAALLHEQAVLHLVQESEEEAETLLYYALTIREAYLGQRHPDVAQSLGTLAVLYRDQGRYEEAEPLFRQAIRILERSLGKKHPILALLLDQYAVLLREIDDGVEADRVEARVRRIHRRRATG